MLNAFLMITKMMNLGEISSKKLQSEDIDIEFSYKILQISLRIRLIKPTSSNQGRKQPIELLCTPYGQ